MEKENTKTACAKEKKLERRKCLWLVSENSPETKDGEVSKSHGRCGFSCEETEAPLASSEIEVKFNDTCAYMHSLQSRNAKTLLARLRSTLFRSMSLDGKLVLRYPVVYPALCSSLIVFLVVLVRGCS